MENFLEEEKIGLRDFFNFDTYNMSVSTIIAKTLHKSYNTESTNDDSLNIIMLYSTSIHNLLSKKLITKEILMKYILAKRIPVQSGMTKSNMIDKIIEYWKLNNNKIKNKENVQEAPTQELNIAEFPINIMAKNFVKWFFENYNDSKLTLKDFWDDGDCTIKIQQQHTPNINDNETITTGNDMIIKCLQQLKEQHGLNFNPNITFNGVQGRINSHGLVLILACGTLHTINECIGLFEAVFGLVKDPYLQNNWRIKTMKLHITNKIINNELSLGNCENLTNLMLLPTPEGDL